ncbi:ABC transporter permease [Sphingomonas sp. Y38-1Y]|uniref:ABC transporter permease n=1 Tax=Sphingomonas sp. Y38-1Y TaxID=3078265 RepID=UPI0028F15148|nr:ABC transporter permease [Sphingomonas sp. Y38-1Y]
MSLKLSAASATALAFSPGVAVRLLPERTAPPAPIAPATVAPRRLSIGRPHRWGWLLGPALFLLYWSVLSAGGWIDDRVLPAPWVAARTAAGLVESGRLQADLAISAWRAAQGLTLGVLVGIALALVSGLSLLGGYVVDGLVQLKRGVPVLALIPFLVLWFGVGEAMKVTTIAVTVFVPIYIHTHNALRAIDLRHVELAETLGLSRTSFIRHVVLPGALPGLLLGLRFGVTAAWLALVVVEQLNATSGIGYMVTLARNYAQTDVMLVGLVIYALLGFASDAVVRLIQGRALGWRRTLAQ